ncbi:T9SS type A sorting domain-containing protein [Patiriisocius sp. Uisw_017]|jgi:endonuclease/exonuclease/phosphatase family metal-dependent hydrolase|uniref:T9SS type A sorting domain-containing protein n=1 Tax=Patiriisocius sp. Uisw_017 TaxID=3230968 RepID=UPI0039EAFA0A
MFYNLLEFPEALPGDRSTILKNILNEYNPDIFMVCELQNQEGADLVLDIALNDVAEDYNAAPFIFNTSSDAELNQLLYYRKGMFTLEETQVIQTTVRDINRYQLKVSTTDQETDPIIIQAYVCHLKSSQGTANQNLRLDMVNQFFANTETLNPNAYVLFAGDFNVYRATEPAYEALLDTSNTIPMVDPIDTPGSWNNNPDFQEVHTQSTRISSSGFGAGAGGGMDDRFDFILISENLMTEPKLKYVPDTYKSFGNNGNCYNNNVSSEDCMGEFSQTLRNSIYSMSDHLPVVMTFETNKEIVLNTPDFQTENPSIEIENTLAQENLNLRIIDPNLYGTDLFIYNTLGQKISSYTLTSQPQQQVGISGLADGIYYLKTNQSLFETFKFIKTF